jgi:hypothetical protein
LITPGISSIIATPVAVAGLTVTVISPSIVGVTAPSIITSGIIPSNTRIISACVCVISPTGIIPADARITVISPSIAGVTSPGIDTVLDPHVLTRIGIATPVQNEEPQNGNDS